MCYSVLYVAWGKKTLDDLVKYFVIFVFVILSKRSKGQTIETYSQPYLLIFTKGANSSVLNMMTLYNGCSALTASSTSGTAWGIWYVCVTQTNKFTPSIKHMHAIYSAPSVIYVSVHLWGSMCVSMSTDHYKPECDLFSPDCKAAYITNSFVNTAVFDTSFSLTHTLPFKLSQTLSHCELNGGVTMQKHHFQRGNLYHKGVKMIPAYMDPLTWMTCCIIIIFVKNKTQYAHIWSYNPKLSFRLSVPRLNM